MKLRLKSFPLYFALLLYSGGQLFWRAGLRFPPDAALAVYCWR